MPAFRLLQADAGELADLAQQAHILEAASPHGVGIFLMLHEQGKVLGDLRFRDIVPVIQMVMGDDHRIHLQQGRYGQRQLDKGVAKMAVGHAFEAGVAPLGGQHGVDEEAGSCVVDEQGGVANLGNLHGVLRFLVGDTASMEG